MRSLLSLGAGAALLALALTLLLDGPGSPERPAGHDEIPSVAAAVRAPAASSARKRGPASVAPKTTSLKDRPLSEVEKESVKTLLGVLANYDQLEGAAKLTAELQKAKLHPRVARDANPDTGALAMVRTEDALPGTRYFHAQVFEGEKGAAHTQHLSFEIRPGSDAMDVATSLIKQNFRDLGNPLVQKDDYVLWRNREGRVVSAKRMTAEDLKGNYFNAHAPGDEGTIWVVSEDDPEEGDEH